MPDTPRSVDRMLPLKPKVLHILLAVADGPRHGYSIMQEVLERTDGQVRLWPAALYGSLRELEKLDLIAESDERPAAEDDDERRRYFGITPHGKRVLGAEVRRLEAIVQRARASRALRKSQRACPATAHCIGAPEATPGSSGCSAATTARSARL
jgi:DNA-binding PadR family transcriptional regulator